MDNMKNKIAGATKWSLITELAVKVIAPVVNMVLAHLLLPEAFGAVATIMMIVSFAELFTDAGFQKYIVQHEFQDNSEFEASVNVAFWSNLVFSSAIVGAIYLFRHEVASLVGSPDLSTGIAVASFTIVVAAFSSIQGAIYRRNFRFKALFTIRIVNGILPIIITIPLAVIFKNFWALVIGNLCREIVNAILLTVKSDWKPRIYYSFSRLKEMFSFTFWTMVESITIWLASYADIFVVGKFLDDYYLGLYKTSMTTVNSCISIIGASMIPVLFSALSRYQNDEKNFKHTYYSFQKNIAVFVMPLGAGIYVFRETIVEILLGNSWLEASDFVGLWGVMCALSVVYGMLASEVYRSKGHPKISLATQIIQLVFLIPALLLSVHGGYELLYTVRSFLRIQYIIVACIALQVLFGIKISATLQNTFPQIISAIVMAVFAIVVKDRIETFAWQLVCIGMCMVVYFGILFLFPSMRKTLLEIGFVQKLVYKLRRPHDDKL